MYPLDEVGRSELRDALCVPTAARVIDQVAPSTAATAVEERPVVLQDPLAGVGRQLVGSFSHRVEPGFGDEVLVPAGTAASGEQDFEIEVVRVVGPRHRNVAQVPSHTDVRDRFVVGQAVERRVGLDEASMLLGVQVGDHLALEAAPANALDVARDAAAGEDVRIGGGPTVLRDFIAAGLVDHLHVVQVPIVLGRGVRLWDGLEAMEQKYDVEVVSTPGGVTHFTFTR